MAECDGEEVVTMMDVLKEQQDFEDDANAVLGGSDEKECTYSQGYIKRQAIYACLTCCPESTDVPSKRAGFCLACSLTCHENHDLVELYTKRNFRCDCGNPKFKSPCQFTPNKPDLNDGNIYNQNFIGLYCICNKPYGDQESTIDDEMIQCIICEDWWHASHLDALLPANDQYSEMVCKLCMAKNEFLHDYSDLTVNNETVDVDVVKVNDSIVADEKLSNDTVTDEEITNGSVTDEKLVNGTATDEKLPNGTEEDSASNVIERSTTEIPIKDSSDHDDVNEVSSTVKDCIEHEKIENESKINEMEYDQENKLIDVPMDTDETDKNPKVLPEVSCGDKAVTENSSELAKDNAEKTKQASEKKVENSSQSEDVQPAETKTPMENNKTNVNSCENIKLSEGAETQATNFKENDESSVQAEAVTPKTQNISANTEKPSENIDISEKVTEDQEKVIEAEKEIIQDSVTESSTTEIAMPSANTNNPPSENITDETKATGTSHDDEQMDDINKENEQVSGDTPAVKGDKINEVDTKTDGSNESDSTNKIDCNINIRPGLPSTEKRKMYVDDDIEDESLAKKLKLNGIPCVRPKGVKKVYKGATFWPSNFRQKLCKCNECISMYKDLSVLFLTDLEDTVFAYETLGKERTAGKPTQYEKGIEALCSLGRIQQIDALTEYNKMRDKLLTFLQSFKERKEIVTEHDIKTFFAGMKPEKRTDGVYFCR